MYLQFITKSCDIIIHVRAHMAWPHAF